MKCRTITVFVFCLIGVFRKRVLDSKEQANGFIETVVFVLDCDQDFYLTTSKTRGLELNVCTRILVDCDLTPQDVTYM